MKHDRRLRAAGLAGCLLAAASALAAPDARTPVRVLLVEGTERQGLLVDGDGEAVHVQLEEGRIAIPLSSVRLIDLGAERDYARDRKVVSHTGHTLLFRDGRVAVGRVVLLSGDTVLWRARHSQARSRIPLSDLRRIYIDVRGLPFGRGDGAALRVGPSTREQVGSLVGQVRSLRERLEATAHHADRYESEAIASLERFEGAAADLAAALAASEADADAAARALEGLIGRAHEVGRAMDALPAYESVRAEWTRLRDHVLPDIADGVRRAL